MPLSSPLLSSPISTALRSGCRAWWRRREELLCRVPVGCAVFASHALTVPILVKIILKISNTATEYAAGALLSLCLVSEQLQRDAVAAGVVTQLLPLVQSDCTERAKCKAQMLLKLLRNSWPGDSIANSDDFGGTDVFPF